MRDGFIINTMHRKKCKCGPKQKIKECEHNNSKEEFDKVKVIFMNLYLFT